MRVQRQHVASEKAAVSGWFRPHARKKLNLSHQATTSPAARIATAFHQHVATNKQYHEVRRAWNCFSRCHARVVPDFAQSRSFLRTRENKAPRCSDPRLMPTS
ncbi:unnamed protein product [Cercospora beticola]|nr:unnamed protein product [Cercospora beticola]